MKNLLFGLIATVVFGFVGNAQNARAIFLQGKNSHKEVVDAYNKLSDDKQKELWMEKFNQIKSLNLPVAHEQLITKLIGNFADGVENNTSEEFFKTAANLAKITPKKDFGYMFETLEDYKYNGKFIDSQMLSDDFIDDVRNLTPFVNATNASLARGNCSCRWCVGMGTTGTNCIVTEHGCGFLWMQSCNQCLICL